jgi:hypothetical protein
MCEGEFGLRFWGLTLTRCEPSGILLSLGIRCVSFCAVPVEIGALHCRFQPASILGTSGHRRKEFPQLAERLKRKKSEHQGKSGGKRSKLVPRVARRARKNLQVATFLVR